MTVGPISIDSYIKNLSFENNKRPLSRILYLVELADTKAEVSFWGTRVISVPDYSGTIAITEIYAKATALLTLNSEDDHKSRLPYIGKELNALNARATAAAKTANFFTRFLVFVRDWFSPVESYQERNS